jgi:hypothetical protein
LTELRIDSEYFETIVDTKDEPTGYCLKEATGGPEVEGDVFADDCGWSIDEPVGWQALGNATEGSRQEYNYALTEAPGILQYLQVVSTGRAGDVYRSVKASIARETVHQWVYFTNYSMADSWNASIYGKNTAYLPELTSAPCGGGWAKGSSLAYAWEIPPGPARKYDGPTIYTKDMACEQPYFGISEPYDGAFHSNDTVFALGARFNRSFTTSNPACQAAVEDDPSTWQNCVKSLLGMTSEFDGGAPSWRPVLEMPEVGDAKAHSESGVGCRYTGPTQIKLEGDMMRVWSKETQAVDVRPNCGSLTDLHSTGGAMFLR